MPKILGWRRPGKIGRCRHFSIYLNLGEQKARKTAEWERQKRAKRFAKAQGCLPFYYIWPVGQAVKTAASHAANRSSILLRVTIYALLAQLVEQLTLNQRAPGSSPWKCTKENPDYSVGIFYCSFSFGMDSCCAWRLAFISQGHSDKKLFWKVEIFRFFYKERSLLR